MDANFRHLPGGEALQPVHVREIPAVLTKTFVEMVVELPRKYFFIAMNEIR